MKKRSTSDLLRQYGLRSTDIRQAVLGLFVESGQALSQQDLDEKLPDNDRVTLYRTLRTFEEKGLIHRAVDGTTTSKYALCQDECTEHHHVDEHAHFHCSDCGVTYCVDGVSMPRPPENLQGFRIDQVYLVLEGQCGACAELGNRPKAD